MSDGEPPDPRLVREEAQETSAAARAARERSEEIRIELDLLRERSKAEPVEIEPEVEGVLRAHLVHPPPPAP
ncbi:hypothetical protein [Actinomycetospora sp. TBRC 11914]|uniref:hypothetical protein n=1 Tax=Actinomycetospora sp. TBRC 11914 TaxID=2729387 RepID=UPI00145D1372|nr:hypothetical protein [Actinomycetospora sp. TBRC 11914]NMO93128.1 hypothetical protein [Actinomycetospora sp. TBRC 11914]